MDSSIRRTIGVFINRFDNAFHKEVCTTLSRLCREAGYDMLVFNSFGNSQSSNAYESLERLLIDLAPIEKLEAAIIMPDTYMTEDRIYLVDQLNKRARRDCPIVAVRSYVEGFCAVLVDEKRSINGIINHIIEDHGCKRIAYLSGTRGQGDAVMRLDCFHRVMAEHGMPVPPNAIFHGNFWRTCAQAAAQYFFDGEDAYKPDAVICANDYMALALMNEILSRGLLIPSDVIVTGYDNVPEASAFSPSLTTMDTDYRAMALAAFNIATQSNKSEWRPETVYIPTRIMRRESCGCAKDMQESSAIHRKSIYEQLNQIYNTQVWQLYFNINVSGCEELSQILDYVEENMDDIEHYRNFAMCLCEMQKREGIGQWLTDGVTDRFSVAMAIKEKERLMPDEDDPRFSVGRDWPLPALITSDTPQTYYFCALHNRSHFFGYTVISFENDAIYTPEYQTWMVSISGAYSDLCNRKQLEQALEQNRRMSITDPLTGLLNRRGFEMFSRKQCADKKSNKDYIIMICFDLDGLKNINDKYGHAEGDFALQTVAQSIRETIDEYNGIASRSGGDEFVAMFIGDDGKGEEACEHCRSALERISKESDKPYNISASMGVKQMRISEDFSLEHMMRECDESLYQAKARLRRRREDR